VGRNLQHVLTGGQLRILARAVPNSSGDNVEYVQGDVTVPSTLGAAVEGCHTVINLVAIITEDGGATFDGVIRGGTEHLVDAARRAGVKRFLQMSALGARNDDRFPYFVAKWRAEEAVKSSGIPWTIVRPSIIYGPGDGFLTLLADLVRTFPIVPVAGTGQSKFQPIAVSDIAGSLVAALEDSSVGKIHELGGPDVFTYEELLDLVGAKIGKKKPKIRVPVGLLKPIVKLSKPLPMKLRPPVTEDQLNMLAIDNCTDHSDTERLLGRSPLKLADNIDYLRQRG
jgi:NADH dehydrogenase